jgi:hypothetical protein
VIKSFTVELTGTSALLQNRFTEQAEQPGPTRHVHIVKKTPREQAEQKAYRLASGQLYLPGAAIARLLREAGAAHKATGSRRSLKYTVPAATLVREDAIGLHNGKAIMDFEVDSRPVTIPATKGRIMRHRPRVEEWQATFSLEVNDSLMAPETVHQLLNEGGVCLGLGDSRPEKGGPFGRFRVTNWEPLKA